MKEWGERKTKEANKCDLSADSAFMGCWVGGNQSCPLLISTPIPYWLKAYFFFILFYLIINDIWHYHISSCIFHIQILYIKYIYMYAYLGVVSCNLNQQ